MWTGDLKSDVAVGPLTVERVTSGRYEWRDAGYVPTHGARRGIWEGSRIWDPGR